MEPTTLKNKRNVSLEIFKTSVCFLSMTVQLGVANKDWFKKSERGADIVKCEIPKLCNFYLPYIINITVYSLYIYRLWIA